MMCALGVIITVLAYPAASVFGRDTVPEVHAKAMGPAQAVAISTQSSLASLPQCSPALANYISLFLVYILKNQIKNPSKMRTVTFRMNIKYRWLMRSYYF